jgi:hypothetical protein
MDMIMTTNPQPADIHSFISATLNADRLKLISYLSQDACSIQDLAKKLDQNPVSILSHIEVLEDANLVTAEDHHGNRVYSFNSKFIELLARQQLSQNRNNVDLSSIDLTEDQKSLITNYTRADGSLIRIPSQSKKIIIILEYIVYSFEFETNYSEKEVNEILKRFHPDIPALRRYLIDYGYLGREKDGSRYWRLATPKSNLGTPR